MSKIVIKVENLSKQYRLGQVSTGTLAHDVNRWWHQIRGKEDPYLKVGEANDRTTTGTSEYVWALKDVGFELKQGEVLGIIGRNGAGKSTLLKILSRTTAPTTGSVKVKGRIASLLEVGTGFHPELSGRENIFLNGAILGMTKNEIKRKFDEIVDFAGVERYIETPVKRYSSGMYVRLAFAVAAHLEPEILIVDEVLAVGDAEFQKKCLGKMKDVSEKEGRTVLFVSHNMAAIRQLCTKAVLLNRGTVESEGGTNEVCHRYLTDNNTIQGFQDLQQVLQNLPDDPSIKILDVKLFQNRSSVLNNIMNGTDLEIYVKYLVFEQTEKLRIYIDVMDKELDLLLRSFHDEKSSDKLVMYPGIYESSVIIPKNFFGPSNYELLIGATIHKIRTCWENGAIRLPINVINTGDYNKAYPDDVFRCKIALSLTWKTREVKS